jgi:hypothetical protein
MREALGIATVLMIIATLTVAAQEKAKPDEPKAKSGHETMTKSGTSPNAAKIARAMSAAPPSISKNATIMEITADGKMKQLRDGTNGWMNKKDPQVKGIGLAYMLKGDKGVSNTDPYATKAAADNHWVVSGPHVMVIVPDTAQLDALPTDPWNGGPWVMWKGTKYAHIMMPTVPTPKAAAPKASTK